VIPDPFGSATLATRARAYLHTNCANCHLPGGPAPSDIDFRYTTALNATNTCDITPTHGNLGITNPRIIAPGSAARSVTVARINRVGADAMPPLSRHIIDTAGVQLLTDWVNGLANCN
jgi:mono/diheme cytochrome c family protein